VSFGGKTKSAFASVCAPSTIPQGPHVQLYLATGVLYCSTSFFVCGHVKKLLITDEMHFPQKMRNPEKEEIGWNCAFRELSNDTPFGRREAATTY
jgi:hypothetical protein